MDSHAPLPYLNVLTEKTKTPTNELVVLDIAEDILYVQHIQDAYTHVVCKNGTTYYTSTLYYEVEKHLCSFDYYEYVSRNLVVNMSKIKFFESNSGKLYFESEPTKDSLCVVANRNIYHKIEKWYDYKTIEKAEKVMKKSKGVFGRFA